jgi:hypothetical protein
MTDEFRDHDLDTPTEADLDLAYGSKYLSSGDIGDRKIRTSISKVRKETLRGNDGRERQRFILFFGTLDKPMVVNATNKDELVSALGRVPANWIGATVGLHVVPTQFAGRPAKGLRIKVLSKPAAPPTARPQTAKPLRPQAAEDVPSEQPGDPGFEEPDPGRDFSQAATE